MSTDKEPTKLVRCPEKNAYGKRCVSHLNKEGTHKGPHTLNGRVGSWDASPWGAGDGDMSEGEWQAFGRYGY